MILPPICADGEAIKRAYFGFGDEPAAADEPEEEAA